MQILSLDYIRQHSRLCSNEEDALLTLYANSAEESVCQMLNRGETVAEVVTSLVEQYGKIPDNIIQASLLLVDQSYMQRSPVSMQNLYVVPYSFDILVKPYMQL